MVLSTQEAHLFTQMRMFEFVIFAACNLRDGGWRNRQSGIQLGQCRFQRIESRAVIGHHKVLNRRQIFPHLIHGVGLVGFRPRRPGNILLRWSDGQWSGLFYTNGWFQFGS